MILTAMGVPTRPTTRSVSATRYSGLHFDDWDDDEIDVKEVTILQAIGRHRRFVYDYDFGDSWSHEVVVEDFRRMPNGLKHAGCLDGQNACPPEDCGGTGGYARLCEALEDRFDDEHDEYMTRAGESFDPSVFDLAVTNAALQRVR